MQDTAGIFLISCNRNRFFSDMMDVSMLIQNAKEGCGLDEKELLRQLQEQRAGALETAIAQYGAYVLAVIRNRSRGVLTPGDHGSTFGANPIAAAAGNVVLDTLTDEFLEEVRQKGQYLREKIEAMDSP